MQRIHRRSFVQLALAAVPSALLGQTATPRTSGNSTQASSNIDGSNSLGAQEIKPLHVSSGTDREGKQRVIGVSATTYKVLTKDTGGALFVMEQSNGKKGGPPRHVHHEQNEVFYVMEGEYIVEIGADRFHLKAGDCVLGPRKIPHAWAFAGEGTGRMLISFAPAGQMEAFFDEWEHAGVKPGTYASTSGSGGAGLLASHGVTQVGPPIALD